MSNHNTMNGQDHYREAERLIKYANGLTSTPVATSYLIQAQVHATLALTAPVAEPGEQLVPLSAGELDQILSALRNRGDDANGDSQWRELYGRLSAVADGMR